MRSKLQWCPSSAEIFELIPLIFKESLLLIKYGEHFIIREFLNCGLDIYCVQILVDSSFNKSLQTMIRGSTVAEQFI